MLKNHKGPEIGGLLIETYSADVSHLQEKSVSLCELKQGSLEAGEQVEFSSCVPALGAHSLGEQDRVLIRGFPVDILQEGLALLVLASRTDSEVNLRVDEVNAIPRNDYFTILVSHHPLLQRHPLYVVPLQLMTSCVLCHQKKRAF